MMMIVIVMIVIVMIMMIMMVSDDDRDGYEDDGQFCFLITGHYYIISTIYLPIHPSIYHLYFCVELFTTIRTELDPIEHRLSVRTSIRMCHETSTHHHHHYYHHVDHTERARHFIEGELYSAVSSSPLSSIIIIISII